MAVVISISRFAPIALAYLLLLSATVSAINITAVLSPFPDLSTFAGLLASSGVAAELAGRSSITLLAVPNSHLSSSAVSLARRLPPSSLADLLRFHVLLQFLSDSDLRRIPPSGSTITTLYDASGRAFSGSGSVNVTRDPATGSVSVRSPTSNVTVLNLLVTLSPNIVTVLSVDSLLVPAGIDLTASESLTPPPSSPSSLPTAGINITQALINGHDFNVAISMLVASGVIADFESDERGAGITVFVPTDDAFSDLPANMRLQSLPADQKAVVLKFHVLHSYYPLGSLESITNPVQPTLATEEMGAGSYTLNIFRVNGSGITIDSGVVHAHVTQTVFDQNPVSIFGISKVLLPKELFDGVPGRGSGSGQGGSSGDPSPPHEISLSPESSDDSPSRLSSPPDDISSGGRRKTRVLLAMRCIAFCVLVMIFFSH
ncbi:PREDICTED: fasciclin-like arabinogalactan protein 4 [Tarenaya hassleriana]|uniref:fasciclin-like arabinogalactan protein 4 n=1 Tax=Tarenaya hassleriana TaxID=28532 RepID=UPI00053C66B2|nr:PREDICTED: fasciclin-like arabinogalactan protein 4 [Tarenaya hassleriana]